MRDGYQVLMSTSRDVIIIEARLYQDDHIRIHNSPLRQYVTEPNWFQRAILRDSLSKRIVRARNEVCLAAEEQLARQARRQVAVKFSS
jgi:hypothetical protein